MSERETGTLYVVATPIGNLKDMTLRAIELLGQVTTIACEDTRVTGNLLRHLEIDRKRLVSYFAGNEVARTAQLMEILREGTDVALVSDAGTPGISDPGSRLIAAAIDAGITVVPLPGPSAAIAALVVSGLPTDAFVFEGFLPHKKGRQTKVRRLAQEERTVILYESPHRIVKALGELVEHCGGERRGVICRELTKRFEEINRGSLAELHADYSARVAIKGEFVLLIEGVTSSSRERPLP